MQCRQNEGLVWYTFSGPGSKLRHAVLTRQGGVSRGDFSSLNLGNTVGDDPAAVQENHRRVFTLLDVRREAVVSPHQVHGREVVRVDAGDGGRVIPGTDALMTNRSGVALMLRFADCTPVLFFDAVHGAVALAHAGWRGVAAGVLPATIRAMAEAFGTQPGDLWAGIGPAIGPERYEVGPEVVEAIQAVTPPGSTIAEQRQGSWYLDLPGAVALQLQANGVGQIEPAGFCTATRTDLWFSHRAERGKTGRFGVLAVLE